MASTFYMKLYYEIIDDPKMGRMSDHDWRRCLEFFMLAGEFDHDGYLPEVKDIAWRLRTSEEKIQKNIDFLCEKDKKIITKTKDGYLITNYVKRQGRISDAKRMESYRERKRISDMNETEVLQNCNKVVTSRNTDIDIDTNIDKITDIDDDGLFSDTSKLSELSKTFEVETKMPVRYPEKWMTSIRNMFEAGVTPQMLKDTIYQMKNPQKGGTVLTIGGPWSCEGMAIDKTITKSGPDMGLRN